MYVSHRDRKVLYTHAVLYLIPIKHLIMYTSNTEMVWFFFNYLTLYPDINLTFSWDKECKENNISVKIRRLKEN